MNSNFHFDFSYQLPHVLWDLHLRSWHWFTNLLSPIHKYFLNEIWCSDYFNDVKCILMPPQDLEKVGWFQSIKNNKYFNISIKINCGLMSRTRYLCGCVFGWSRNSSFVCDLMIVLFILVDRFSDLTLIGMSYESKKNAHL